MTEANAPERLGAIIVLDEAKEKLSRLEVIWVDQGYSGKNFANAVQQVCGEQVRVEVIERTSYRLHEVQLYQCASVFIRVRFFLYRTQLQTAIYIIQNIHNSLKLDDSSNRPVGILNLWTP